MSLKDTDIQGDANVSRHFNVGGRANIHGDVSLGHGLKVEGWLDAPNVKGPNKGLFISEESLTEAYPEPRPGWWALVGDTLPAPVYRVEGGEWIATGEVSGEVTIDCEQFKEDVHRLDDTVADLTDDTTDLKERMQVAEDAITGLSEDISTLTNAHNGLVVNFEAHKTQSSQELTELRGAVTTLAGQTGEAVEALGGYKLREISEDDYETALQSGTLDGNTVYLIPEEDTLEESTIE